MKYGSVCSGIEAATVAWHTLGWTPSWFAEIEPFPCSVLAHHYPHVPNLGDMTKIKKSILQGRVEVPDVLVGGTPCQAFSVAGLRNSLDDQRGQLTLEFVRLANAIDFIRAKRKQQPSIIVWENVPGVLSSKDNAFGCFLAGLVGESSELQPAGNKWTNAGCVFGPERAVAWRVLDAQYFGLAQRRRRVFVVASARKDINCTKILFEFDSVRRDIAPSREPKQNVAATIEASLGRSRGAGTPIGGLWWTGADVADTLTCSSNNQRMPDKNKIQAVITLASKQQSLDVRDNLASALLASDYKEPQVVCVHGTQDPCTTENVAHTLGRNNGQENALVYPINTMTCQGRPSDDLNPRMGLGIGQETDPCPTLTKAHSHAVAYAFDSLSSNSMKSSDTTVPCPSKNQGGIGVLQNNSEIAYGIPGNWIGRKPENGGNATEPPLELSPCLTVADVHAVAQAFQQNTRDEVRYIGGDGQITGALTAESGAKQQNYIHNQMQVRRLTPRECERLQGFPPFIEGVTFKLCLDHQKQNAIVEMKCHKLQSSALIVGEKELNQFVKIVESSFSTNPAEQNSHVVKNAHTHYEVKNQAKLNVKKLYLNVNGVKEKSSFRQLIQIENSAQQLVHILQELVKTHRDGKVELPLNIKNSLHQKYGSKNAVKYGQEIKESAEGATLDLNWEKYTILNHGQNIQMSDCKIQTLFSYAMSVINGRTQNKTQIESFYIHLIHISDYTLVPHNKKIATDSPRYKALGNSMAVPVMHWIGKQIQQHLKKEVAA